jgi:hypothetical protein
MIQAQVRAESACKDARLQKPAFRPKVFADAIQP